MSLTTPVGRIYNPQSSSPPGDVRRPLFHLRHFRRLRHRRVICNAPPTAMPSVAGPPASSPSAAGLLVATPWAIMPSYDLSCILAVRGIVRYIAGSNSAYSGSVRAASIISIYANATGNLTAIGVPSHRRRAASSHLCHSRQRTRVQRLLVHQFHQLPPWGRSSRPVPLSNGLHRRRANGDPHVQWRASLVQAYSGAAVGESLPDGVTPFSAITLAKISNHQGTIRQRHYQLEDHPRNRHIRSARHAFLRNLFEESSHPPEGSTREILSRRGPSKEGPSITRRDRPPKDPPEDTSPSSGSPSPEESASAAACSRQHLRQLAPVSGSLLPSGSAWPATHYGQPDCPNLISDSPMRFETEV